MKLPTALTALLLWQGLVSLLTFTLFGIDKWRAWRGGAQRIAESTLLGLSAAGGWPGGLLGLVLFRHKSAKASFLLKFAFALILFLLLTAGGLRLTGGL